uniref:Uncharacterized protein K02A2.6-like n=1 Tax=Saccoglossus kowalevskii TaxID=10224 RepID=A0ABM0MCA9_SACKO
IEIATKNATDIQVLKAATPQGREEKVHTIQEVKPKKTNQNKQRGSGSHGNHSGNNQGKIPALSKFTSVLSTYTGEKIRVLGAMNVHARYDSQSATVPILVVEGCGAKLLGRNWLKVFKLKWADICHIKSSQFHETLVDKYAEVFQEGLGTVRKMFGKIHVDPNAQPKFFKPRQVPYAMKAKVNLELDRLLCDGIIEPVEFSDWATPIVPVLKGNGNVRICGDYL